MASQTSKKKSALLLSINMKWTCWETLCANWYCKFFYYNREEKWVNDIHINPRILQILLYNSWRFGQNGRYFADDIFKCISMNGKFCNLIQISLKSVPKIPINNKSVLVKVIAWCRIGNIIIWTNADPVHWRIYAGLGRDEFEQVVWMDINTSQEEYGPLGAIT